MVDKVIQTNTVKIVGKMATDLEFSHEMFGEGFYNFYMDIPRLSEHTDTLPITISERLFVDIDLKPGEDLVIEGQLRSYNRYVDGKNKLILTIFARDLYVPEDEEELESLKKTPNEIFLDGYVCKAPIYRTTPLGREITDLLIAVNRPYNKSDYIPCIAWGRNARFSQTLKVGDHIKLWGRVQSREYQKKKPDGRVENKVAYEVSISKMEHLEENNRDNCEE
ncbi:single-stranded DNA-binding protein [Thermohalobacter berrensis]|uniref:Single-stranded DNA-binding protein n=1 Tax=Thermohalobacter berrensis TaxID=99594 RepID=A0A419T4R1_9FIRM|nr:single-stranded DNA-binding protein [Thermohalobacter berrensis]RKD32442.1 single-stranded DNA-binding protein [Thermohalobacter berrensis]